MTTLSMMGAFESILELARTLTGEERVRLAQLLLGRQESADPVEEERSAGDRGLESWTQSAHEEDWSAFYPPSLRQKRVG